MPYWPVLPAFAHAAGGCSPSKKQEGVTSLAPSERRGVYGNYDLGRFFCLLHGHFDLSGPDLYGP